MYILTGLSLVFRVLMVEGWVWWFAVTGTETEVFLRSMGCDTAAHLHHTTTNNPITSDGQPSVYDSSDSSGINNEGGGQDLDAVLAKYCSSGHAFAATQLHQIAASSMSPFFGTR